MVIVSSHLAQYAVFGLVYAWSGCAVMWAFWVSFVIFLCEPRLLLDFWPLQTVDKRVWMQEPWAAAAFDLCLVALFALQHSMMARRWFKDRVARMPEPFVRCTYVHMANTALFLLIIFWQPLPVDVWTAHEAVAQTALWALFAAGWAILFLGAWSFGISDLLGIQQMHAWINGRELLAPRLKTTRLYRWFRHPMYVGVLLGVWATPRMSVGHLLLAVSLTAYVLIAMRYEERDLLHSFGDRYARWRYAAHAEPK
jgi:protein-S-isoprenylcysteine O-methyltransferase Ste14